MLQGLLTAIGIYKLYEKWLSEQIQLNTLPSHIGVIMDGNRRWARSQDMQEWQGHWSGADKVEELLNWCVDIGIKTITLYSFSTENFSRPNREIDELMKLFEKTMEDTLKSDELQKHKVKVRAIGRINMLPPKIQTLIHKIEEKTNDFDKFYLNIAIAYGGRAEIVDAAKKIGEMVKTGKINPDDIDEELIEENLYTSHLPQQDPDLIIRTSGESRLSNFLVWQSAYSELFIVDVFWPAFRKIDMMRAIRSYQQRLRRYGK
jgi:tritrans,polycis-undecaprenyl-diphosphate synthase [geranylgeranyl-diphosphate specific]